MKKPVKHVAIPTVPTTPASVTAVAVAVAVAGSLFAAGCAWFGSPAKPAGEVVPATAYLTVTNRGSYKVETVTITDRSTVAQIAKLINALPVATGGAAVPCPSSPDYDLDFRAAENSPPVAQVTVDCSGIYVTVHSQSEPTLGYGSAGETGFLKSFDALIPSVVANPPAE
jgi:hypothetical protein